MHRKFVESFLAVVLVSVLFLEQVQPVTASHSFSVPQQNDSTPTPTAAATTAVTPTPVEATLTTTETSVSTPATPEATITPTPTALENTEVPLPSDTLSTPAATVPEKPVEISMETYPAFAPRSGKVSLTWKISGLQEFEPGVYEIQITLPDGLMATSSADATGETTGSLIIPVTDDSGQLDLNVQDDVPGPFVLSAILFQNDSPVAKAEYVLEKAPGISLDRSGGVAAGLDNRVQVTFPQDALDDLSTVWISNPSLEHLPDQVPSPLVFEVMAQNAVTKEVKHQFTKPLQFTVTYDPAAFDQYREGELTLLWYNEEFQEWDPIISRVNPETNTLSATVKHLSLFAVGTDDIGAALPPFLDTLQTSGFSGAVTYSIPIQLPAGPGGLQPSLSLDYNSQVVDESTSHTQASWVGMGWSLETGRITRDFHGTPDDLNDDTFNISLNGLNGTLVLGSDGYYHTSNETFWQITLSSNTWTVKDKIGNEYTFTSKATYPTYSYPNGVCEFSGNKSWVWVLTSVKNQFRDDANNYIVYNYGVWNKYGGVSQCDGSLQGMHTAVFLDSIVYPNARYRISFVRAGRADYLPNWDTDTSLRVPFEKEYLTQILIEHDATGSGSYATVRKYVLSYETNDSLKIFSGISWAAGSNPSKAAYNGMLTLKSVQEYGQNNAALPATVFTYGDNMHLTRVENGYGGKVEFTYDIWFQTPSGSSNTSFEDLGVYPNSCEPNSSNRWSGDSNVYCDNRALQIRNNAIASNRVNNGDRFTHPGAVYHVAAYFHSGEINALGMKVGLSYWVGANELQWYGQLYSSGIYAEGYLLMPANASKLNKGLVVCSICAMDKYLFETLPTKYRLIEKKVYDGLEAQIGDQPATFTYQYDGGAVNDDAHSDYIKNYANVNDRYVKAYAEYRGNAAVTEVGPDNRATTTVYQQYDVFRGQSIYTYTARQDYGQTFNVTKYPGVGAYGYTVGGTVNMTLPDFCSNNSTYWTCAGSGTAAQADLEGDEALSLSGAVTVHRPDNAPSISEKEAAILQFQTGSGTANTRQLLLTVNSGGISLGISVRRDASGNLYVQSECTGCSGFSPTIIIPVNTYKDNTWYLLFLVVDRAKAHLEVLARNDPAVSYRMDLTLPELQGRTWYFSAESSAGCTSYLDTYQEGELHLLSLTTLASQEPNDVTVNLPKKDNNTVYPTVKISWTYPTSIDTFTFWGAEYQISQTEYSYDTALQGGKQYGNVTDIYQSTWVNNTVTKYLQVRKRYYPNSTTYLVGLPAYENYYACPDGNCSTNLDDTTNPLASTNYLYDTNTNYDQVPTAGKLKTKRVLVRFDNGAKYQDTSYQYDTWGNTTKTTQYTAEGTATAVGGGTQVVTTTYYDPFYHTYPTAITDALGYTTTIDYDYALGVPVRETGANGIHGRVYASYDNFGRMLSLTHGDDAGTASLSVVYSDTNPFWVEVTQKITSSQNSVTRKYYDGLGRIFQTQVIGATVNGTANQTIRSDTYYDAYGRAYRQSVPYVNTDLTGYQMDGNQANTETMYDTWGRTSSVEATDNTITSTAYSMELSNNPFVAEMLQKVTTTDANGHTSASLINTRGQVVKVQPQIGPAVSYYYDDLGKLIESVYGNATSTSITYDQAGQKTGMTDPDMGTWSYTYTSQGLLTTQTDARACTTTLAYDLLGRLTGKTYSGSDAACTRGNGPTYTGPSYTYAAQNTLYEQGFDGTNLPADWSLLGSATFSGGQAHMVGNNTWNNTLYRTPYTITNPRGTKIIFKATSGAKFNIFLDTGTYGTSSYRRWGISADGTNNIYRTYYEGTGGYSEKLVMKLKGGTWYQLVLETGADGSAGKFRLALLEQSSDNLGAEVLEDHSNAWQNLSWRMIIQPFSGTMDIDQYQEIQFDNKTQRRTGMTDASGSTTWDYDPRGRMISETKTVTGAGTYTTAWTYNYADGVASMTYPTGETVNYSYLNQLLPNTMSGTTAYVTGSKYDAAGRTVERDLGNSLITKYFYKGWETDAGRLWKIQTGTSGNATSLQSLMYGYDPVGNILSIEDEKVAGGTQTQTFTYDEINRLITAMASGGNNGTYPQETYAYDPFSGNLVNKAGLVLHYPDTNRNHAVRSTSGSNSWSFTYDANGNMTTSNQTGTNLTYNYNAENQLVSVSSGETYTYDGDGSRVAGKENGKTTYYINPSFELEQPDTLSLSVQSNGTQPNSYTYRTFDATTTYTIVSGDRLEYDIFLDASNPTQRGGLDAVLSSSGTVRDHSGWVDQNGITIHPSAALPNAMGQWYHRVFEIGSKTGQTLSNFKIVHEGDAAGYTVIRLANIKITKTDGSLQKSIYSGGIPLSNIQAEGPTSDILFQTTLRATSYYQIGGQRAALRRAGYASDNGMKWIFTDHLGSTNVITDASGNTNTVTLYKPWGEIRYGGNTSITTYAFTGQRDSGIGLYFYNARWYSSYITQWAQPDQIIPDPYNPLDWNRYAYVRYNPINFNDPSGHKACSSDGNSFDSCTDPLAEPTNWGEIEKIWGIKFEGQDSEGNSTWTEQRKIWALGAVVATGTRLAEGTNIAAFTAFQMTYAASNPLIFLFGTSVSGHYLSTVCSVIGSGGCTSNDHGTIIINFWDTVHQYRNANKFMRNVVHELGHAFNDVFSNGPAIEYSKLDLGRDKGGFAGGRGEWQFAYTNVDTYSEILADSFVGWTYNTWENDPQGYGARRQSFMNTWVPYYFNSLLER